MPGERTTLALKRIADATAALERQIALAAAKKARVETMHTREVAKLTDRHERLRTAVTETLRDIDDIIAGSES